MKNQRELGKRFMISLFARAVIVFALLHSGEVYARTHHYSSYSEQPAVYLKAIEQFKNAQHRMCAKDGVVRAGIVTHHFLASQMMVEFFECLANQARPGRIVLIGPDHFGKGISPVTVSSLPWKTPFGELRADGSRIAGLKKTLRLPDDPEAFSGEHSMGILVPFIRYYFPESVVMPVIIQPRISPAMLKRFMQILEELLDDPGTIILLSTDFAHNRTSYEADRLDRITKRIISGFDFNRVQKAEVDCRPGLALLLAALKDREKLTAHFLNHTNSAKITGNRNQKDVTSYFTVIFSIK